MFKGDIDIFYPYFFFISVNSFICLSILLGESISLPDSRNVFDQYFHIPDPIFFLLRLKIYQLTIISFFLNIVVFIIFLRIFGNIWYYIMISLYHEVAWKATCSFSHPNASTFRDLSCTFFETFQGFSMLAFNQPLKK